MIRLYQTFIRKANRIVLALFLTILPIVFLGSFSNVHASNIDVSLSVPKVPISNTNSFFDCNPRKVTVGGSIHCRAYLVDTLGEAMVAEIVKVISNRNSNQIVDQISPISKATDISGDADFIVTSNVIGDATLYAARKVDQSVIGSSVGIKFLPQEISVPVISFSDIYSDKTKLIIGKDNANISVKILDQNKNPIPSLEVILLYDLQYGEINQDKSLTNELGIASFIYTPKKKGTAEIGAMTSAITLDKKLYLAIVESSLLEKIQSSEIAKQVASALNPVVTTTAVLSLISLIASLIGSAPATLHTTIYLISLILEAIGLKRKKRNWGRVYDSTTGKVVEQALVRLYNQQSMQLVGTIVTGQGGRYNFKSEPGNYVITVSKEGYIYPTEVYARFGIAKANKTATKAFSHYIGQPINITEKHYSLNIDIPIDPIGAEFSFFFKAKIWIEGASSLVANSFSGIFIPILILGTLASSFVAIIIPVKRNIIMAIAYLVFTLIYALIKMIRADQLGSVVDEEGNPLSGVMISIFEKNYLTLKETQITNRLGRFLIFADKGEYILKAQKEGYEFDPKKLEQVITINRAKNKYIGKPIMLKNRKYINLTVIGKKI